MSQSDDLVAAVTEAGEEFEVVLYDHDINFPQDAIWSERGEQHRWWYRMSYVFGYHGKYYRLDVQMPSTEMQEGQDWHPEFYEVERITKRVVDFIRPPVAY